MTPHFACFHVSTWAPTRIAAFTFAIFFLIGNHMQGRFYQHNGKTCPMSPAFLFKLDAIISPLISYLFPERCRGTVQYVKSSLLPLYTESPMISLLSGDFIYPPLHQWGAEDIVLPSFCMYMCVCVYVRSIILPIFKI